MKRLAQQAPAEKKLRANLRKVVAKNVRLRAAVAAPESVRWQASRLLTECQGVGPEVKDQARLVKSIIFLPLIDAGSI